LAKGLLPLLHTCVSEALKKRGTSVEVGGMWIGEFNGAGAGLDFKLQGLADAGPKAVCLPESVLFDHDYQARMLAAIQLQHPRAGNMGCFHRHPGTLYQCSAGDKESDQAAVADSDTRALVFTIITLGRGEAGALSLHYRHLRLDFYVMAEQTGFEYLPVRPSLLDIPVLQASPAMARLSLIRGPDVFHDLSALRRMSGLQRVSVSLVERGLRPGVWLAVGLSKGRGCFHIWVKENGALNAFTRGSQGVVRELPGPWQQPEVGRHVWLSHLSQEALSESMAEESLCCSFHGSELLADKKRLVAEVRAMQEKFGERAVLRSDRGQLYWEYTVEESGRRFPIQVRYPKHYPAKPPRVYSVLPLPHSPHQLASNELCWIDQFSFRGDWNPARDTAAVCINAAHRWFACLLVYLTLGKWPAGADDQPGRTGAAEQST
jgi:ubiquitin-protein ligase